MMASVGLALLWALLALGCSDDGTSAFALTHVTVVDASGTAARDDFTVLVTSGRIAALGPTARVDLPPGTAIVDGSERFVIPGLWDMHVHLRDPQREFPLFLANGVTGVRDMGNQPEQVFAWRRQVDSGETLGPRIVACGPIVDGPLPADPQQAIGVADAAQAELAVRALEGQGADCLKVHDGVPAEAYRALVLAARRAGLPVVGHVPVALTMLEASEAGQRTIEHLGSFLEFGSGPAAAELASDPKAAPEDPSSFPHRLAVRGGRMLASYDRGRADRLFARLAANGTFVVPTLVVKRVQAEIDAIHAAGELDPRYVPAATRAEWEPGRNFFFRYRTPEYVAFRRRLYELEIETVGAMARAGVPLLAGTDLGYAYTVAGFSLQDELGLLVEAGLTPLAALRAATLGPARALELVGDVGTVEVGKAADLVVLDGDPLADIRNLRRIRGVVVRGRWLDRDALDALLNTAEAAS